MDSKPTCNAARPSVRSFMRSRPFSFPFGWSNLFLEQRLGEGGSKASVPRLESGALSFGGEGPRCESIASNMNCPEFCWLL